MFVILGLVDAGVLMNRNGAAAGGYAPDALLRDPARKQAWLCWA